MRTTVENYASDSIQLIDFKSKIEFCEKCIRHFKRTAYYRDMKWKTYKTRLKNVSNILFSSERTSHKQPPLKWWVICAKNKKEKSSRNTQSAKFFSNNVEEKKWNVSKSVFEPVDKRALLQSSEIYNKIVKCYVCDSNFLQSGYKLHSKSIKHWDTADEIVKLDTFEKIHCTVKSAEHHIEE